MVLFKPHWLFEERFHMLAGEAMAILERLDPETELGADTINLLKTVGGLTGREMEILRHLAKGKTTDEMSKELFLSLYTIQNHVSNILFKTRTHSKLEAVVMAVRRGLLTVEELGREEISPWATT
jgi:DNA-binding CsgD family transcriptional regulator